MAAKKKRGRPQKPLSDECKRIFLTLVAGGFATRQALKACGIPKTSLRRILKRDKVFRQQYEQADTERKGTVTAKLMTAMHRMVEQGHPWWAKMAMHTFKSPFVDPDYADLRAKELQKHFDGVLEKIMPLIPMDKQAAILQEVEQAVEKVTKESIPK